MWWYLLPILFLSLSYLLCIILLIYGWDKLSEKKYKSSTDKPLVTVIVAARNEEVYIRTCISSILSQSYDKDKLQLIVVDDFSTDGTKEIVTSFPDILFLELKQFIDEKSIRSGKKKSIELAIQHATGKYILITDADCIVPRNWVSSTVELFEIENVEVVTGPVCIKESKTFFEQLQALDLWSYISLSASAIGLGRPVLANGANFSFTKSLFIAVKGYEGSTHISSGDDVLLLHKFIQHNARVAFNKSTDAIVSTKAEENLLAFFIQRLRWASKSASYKNFATLFIISVVYLYYLSLPFCIIASVVQPLFIKWVAGLLMMKFFIDFMYMHRVLNFFKQRSLLQLFLPAQLFHVFYVIMVGAFALFIPVKWKGRKLYR